MCLQERKPARHPAGLEIRRDAWRTCVLEKLKKSALWTYGTPFLLSLFGGFQSALSVFTMMSVLHLLYKEEKKQGQDKMNQFEPIFRIST